MADRCIYTEWKAEAEEKRDRIGRADDAAVIHLSWHVTLELRRSTESNYYCSRPQNPVVSIRSDSIIPNAVVWSRTSAHSLRYHVITCKRGGRAGLEGNKQKSDSHPASASLTHVRPAALIKFKNSFAFLDFTPQMYTHREIINSI